MEISHDIELNGLVLQQRLTCAKLTPLSDCSFGLAPQGSFELLASDTARGVDPFVLALAEVACARRAD